MSFFTKPQIDYQWMWNSNADPFSKCEPPDWRPYSDIENLIIEKGFVAGQSHVLLDDYTIDLEHKLQISHNHIQKQRPIQRVESKKIDRCPRAERFLPNPIAPDRPYADQYGFISPFLIEVVKYLKLTRDTLPSKNESILPMVVEKAASGIIEEGKKIGARIKAEEIANMLMAQIEYGIVDVWRCCAYVYSVNSFLFVKVNETMRLIGSEQHEQIWRSRVSTLGPYCLLLWDNPLNSKMTQPGRIFYRGIHLDDHVIETLKEDCSKARRPWHSFQSFTSCTRNRRVAEHFGNVLFVMTTRITFTVDLESISSIPNEEEELLYPGVSFTIDRFEFDQQQNKHIFYLTLQQKRNDIDRPLLNRQSTQQTNIGNDNDRYMGNLEDDSNYEEVNERYKFLVNFRQHLRRRAGLPELDSINCDNPKEFDYFLKIGLDRNNISANRGIEDSVGDRFGFDADWNEDTQ